MFTPFGFTGLLLGIPGYGGTSGPTLSLDLDSTAGGRGTSWTFTRGDSATQLATDNVAIVDPGGLGLDNIKIVVSGVQDGANEVLALGADTFPLNANKSTTELVGGVTFAIGYVTATQTFTLTNNAGGKFSVAAAIAAIEAITQVFSGTPTYGVRTFTFTVEADSVVSAPAVATVSVVDQAPVIDAIADTTATVGVEKIITPNNSGGTATLWEITSGTGGSINPSTGVFTYTPSAEGTTNWTIRASNSGGSDTEDFAITASIAPAIPLPSESLALWHELDEGSGTALADKSGNALSGTLVANTLTGFTKWARMLAIFTPDSSLNNWYWVVSLAALPSDVWSAMKSDGGDLRATTIDGSTELATDLWEFDYGNQTGILAIECGTTGTDPTPFLIWCGNASASRPAASDANGSDNVYPASVLAIWPDGGASGTDHSANGNDLTITGTLSTSAGSLSGAKRTIYTGTQYGTLTSNVPTDEPLSVMAIGSVDNSASNNAVFDIQPSASHNQEGYRLQVTTEDLNVHSRHGGTLGIASFSNIIVSAEQRGWAAVWGGDASRSAYYHKNASSGTDTTSIVPAGLNRLRVGAFAGSTISNQLVGSLSAVEVRTEAISRDFNEYRSYMFDVDDPYQRNFYLGWESGGSYCGAWDLAASNGDKMLQCSLAKKVHAVNTNVSFIAGDFSFGCVIIPAELGREQVIASFRDSGSGNGWQLLIDASDNLTFVIDGGAGTMEATYAIGWVHAPLGIIVTYDDTSNVVTMYLQSSVSASASGVALATPSSAQLTLGYDGSTDATRFEGRIGDVVYYSAVLDETERGELFDYFWSKYNGSNPTVSTPDTQLSVTKTAVPSSGDHLENAAGFYSPIFTTSNYVYIADIIDDGTVKANLYQLNKADYTQNAVATLKSAFTPDSNLGHRGASVAVNSAGRVLGYPHNHRGAWVNKHSAAAGEDISTMSSTDAGTETTSYHCYYYDSINDEIYLMMRDGNLSPFDMILFRWNESTTNFSVVGNNPITQYRSGSASSYDQDMRFTDDAIYYLTGFHPVAAGYPRQQIGVMKSKDGGDTWEDLHGRIMSLPATEYKVTQAFPLTVAPDTLSTGDTEGAKLVITASGAIIVLAAYQDAFRGETYRSIYMAKWNPTAGYFTRHKLDDLGDNSGRFSGGLVWYDDVNDRILAIYGTKDWHDVTTPFTSGAVTYMLVSDDDGATWTRYIVDDGTGSTKANECYGDPESLRIDGILRLFPNLSHLAATTQAAEIWDVTPPSP